VGAFPGLLEKKLSIGLSEILGHRDVLGASGGLPAERRGGAVYHGLATA
jgi:hypothetical protein